MVTLKRRKKGAALYLAVLRMKERACSLLSFSTYVNKGFALRRHAHQMSDARVDPEISPASVFLALFYAFVFRPWALGRNDPVVPR
jgi:hypothetical protein